MNCIIKKKEEQLEIPYYQLEKVCKEIVRNYLKEPGLTKEESLKRKKDFFEFRKGIKPFLLTLILFSHVFLISFKILL